MNELDPYHHTVVMLLLQLGVMLVVGLIFGELMRKIHQPVVLGELIGGIVLGPTIFGLIFPGFYSSLFPSDPELNQAREIVIGVGMLFFMFTAGLEVDLASLNHRKRSISLVSILGFLLPFGLGVASVFLFPGLWGADSKNLDPNFILFVGIALSISALPVISRILMDLRLLRTEFGGIVISSAAIIDIIGWSLFAVLLANLSSTNSKYQLVSKLGLTLIVFVFVLAVGRLLGRPLFRWARGSLGYPSGLLGLSAILIILSAAVAETFNIHAIFGAFLMGVALYPVFKQNDAQQVKETIYQISVSVFAPLFFVSVGLKTDFIANFDLQLVLLVVGLATLGKLAGAGLGAWIGGIDFKDATAIGIAMNARGALEIILATLALEFRLIDGQIFVAFVIMALVTSILSGPLLKRLYQTPTRLASNLVD